MCRTLLALWVVGCQAVSHAQCITSGASTTSSAVNNALVGTINWGSTANIATSNNVRASASALLLGNITKYLVSSDYDFSLPSSAVVCGIEVQIERRATGLLQNVTDNSIRLVKEGSLIGENKAASGSWPSSDSYRTYGSSSDTWGTAWTPAEINADGFGVAVAAELNGIAVLPSAQIDHILITVYYDNVLPVELIEFKAEWIGDAVLLQWSTASETDNMSFTVQRSADGSNWTDLARVPGSGTSETVSHYEYLDGEAAGSIYYRLRQTDYSGTESYSDIVKVRMPNQLNELRLPYHMECNMGYVLSPELESVRVYAPVVRLVSLHYMASGPFMITPTGLHELRGLHFSVCRSLLGMIWSQPILIVCD